jgi:histone acetyltransferase (RNA polymerase elongator complex component)
VLIYPIFIPQKGCPFQCIYCDQTQFDSAEHIPLETISTQIEQFCLKHKDKPRQIAFYGGTFTGLTLPDREKYYQLAEPFLDNLTSLRISTRPDFIDPEILNWCKEHQIKTIELGIQDFNDEVLRASKRGYTSKQAIDACLMIKQADFELGIQLMPGLPQSTLISHKESMRGLQGVMPGFVRLYPLIILAGTPMWNMMEKGDYTPLSLEEAISICVDYCEWAEQNGVEVIKIGIPSLHQGSKYAGPYHPAFGELVKGERLIRKIIQGYKPDNIIHISEKEISLLTGHKGYNLIKLLKRLEKCSVEIVPLSSLKRGEVRYSTG